jgi:hypothetical protein
LVNVRFVHQPVLVNEDFLLSNENHHEFEEEDLRNLLIIDRLVDDLHQVQFYHMNEGNDFENENNDWVIEILKLKNSFIKRRRRRDFSLPTW